MPAPDFDDSERRRIRSWREAVALWLMDQGVVTVLLVLILLLIVYVVQYLVPQHIEMIQKGYERQAETFAKSLERVEASHSANLKYIVDSCRELRRQEP